MDRIVPQECEDARIRLGGDSRPYDHDLADLSRGEQSVEVRSRGGFDGASISGRGMRAVAQAIQHDQRDRFG